MKRIVTEGRDKKTKELERKFEAMRKEKDQQKMDKERKDRFERAAFRFGRVKRYEDIEKSLEESENTFKKKQDVLQELITEKKAEEKEPEPSHPRFGN